VALRPLIKAGGIPPRTLVLNRVNANFMNKPILGPADDSTSLGSAIFAFLAAGAFRSIEEAQQALCPRHETIEPDASAHVVYAELYSLYRKLYFAMVQRGSQPVAVGDVLPDLRRIAARARGEKSAGNAAD